MGLRGPQRVYVVGEAGDVRGGARGRRGQRGQQAGLAARQRGLHAAHALRELAQLARRTLQILIPLLILSHLSFMLSRSFLTTSWSISHDEMKVSPSCRTAWLRRTACSVCPGARPGPTVLALAQPLHLLGRPTEGAGLPVDVPSSLFFRLVLQGDIVQFVANSLQGVPQAGQTRIELAGRVCGRAQTLCALL
ncbi:hypothetical protein HW555_001223 [Spodoptera exigua]|uniref:Uncharacterized protein n=1 Tax=Spodoptera exigua TaxID=7107 RepID=A0A835GSW6_SPOEX|nr:hypothetical protein HW555_001223 [Spodoptera exigua]